MKISCLEGKSFPSYLSLPNDFVLELSFHCFGAWPYFLTSFFSLSYLVSFLLLSSQSSERSYFLFLKDLITSNQGAVWPRSTLFYFIQQDYNFDIFNSINIISTIKLFAMCDQQTYKQPRYETIKAKYTVIIYSTFYDCKF